MQAVLSEAPNGSVIVFSPRASYPISASLVISGKNLCLSGNGAIIKDVMKDSVTTGLNGNFGKTKFKMGPLTIGTPLSNRYCQSIAAGGVGYSCNIPTQVLTEDVNGDGNYDPMVDTREYTFGFSAKDTAIPGPMLQIDGTTKTETAQDRFQIYNLSFESEMSELSHSWADFNYEYDSTGNGETNRTTSRLRT